MVEPDPPTWHADWVTAVNQPELHPLYERWRTVADEYQGERMFVGEIVLQDHVTLARYVEPDRLHLAFTFSLLHAEWDADAMRHVIEDARAAFDSVDACPTWVFENHDVTRLATRYGSVDRARAAALLMLALPGAKFLYQGQELGLEEVEVPDAARQDPIFFRTAGERVGRDGCRVPIPWENGPPGFGFTSGTPWLPMPDAWTELTVERQREHDDSTLELYRRALAERPTGPLAWHESPAGTLVFERGSLVCAVNLDAERLELPEGDLVVATELPVDGALARDAAAWIRVIPGG